MLAILADDLTGALDAAAPFAGRGLVTEIALDDAGIADILRERPEVLSINLNSREMSERDAQAVTAMVIASLPAGTTLFKKVDSRLKGNIAAELDVTSFTHALVAPAIPDFGRLVEDQRVTGFGVDAPISIVDRLGRHAARASVPDSRSSLEMDAALDLAQMKGADLLIGARGLAEALARRMTAKIEAEAAIVPRGRAIFVIGSRDPITLAQIEVLRSGGNLHYLCAPNGRLEGKTDTEAELTLVQVTQGTEFASPQTVADTLADGLSSKLLGDSGTLLLSGGATAEAVLRSLGLSRLRLHGECLPGLGLASIDGRCIIAKSGGFGRPETLKTIADMILRKTG